jgi:hypothetical protein
MSVFLLINVCAADQGYAQTKGDVAPVTEKSTTKKPEDKGGGPSIIALAVLAGVTAVWSVGLAYRRRRQSSDARG